MDLLNEYKISFPDEDSKMQIMVVDEEGNSVIFKRMDREMVTVEKEKSWQVVTNFFQFGEDPAAFEKMCNRYTDP